MSLGGVRDEAEIRGHRRTYVGAMPGRIIQAIRRAGTNDPVFVLDEVDKLGNDWRGDPSSALLEVLDPGAEQQLPGSLPGRVVRSLQGHVHRHGEHAGHHSAAVAGPDGNPRAGRYTDDDKLNIARRYLVPKQLKAHGLSTEEYEFTDDALMQIIRHYTREAGVRNLEREIGTVVPEDRDPGRGRAGGCRDKRAGTNPRVSWAGRATSMRSWRRGLRSRVFRSASV